MSESRPLFRPEAIDAQRGYAFGGVQLSRPPALAWITLGVIAALVAVCVFLGFASFTRKVSVSGVLSPDRGLIRVVPVVSGTVVDSAAAEGQQVGAGDVLFVLSLDRPLLSTEAQAQVRRSLQDRQSNLEDAVRSQALLGTSQVAALDRRLQALGREMAQIDSEARLQRERLDMAEQSLVRFQALQADKFMSTAQVQSKLEEVLALRAAAQGLERQRAALARDRAELEGERNSVPLRSDSAISALKRDIAQVSRDSAEQTAEQRLVVRAPQAGTVSTLLAEVGQSVSPAAALATLVPQGAELRAELYAPSSAIGFVQPGQAVRLRFEAFPYQKFGQQPGRVLQVSRTPLGASDLAALALPSAGLGGEPLFRISVALEGARIAEPLSAGMRLQGDVLLERRRLIEWLFEPLLGLKGRL
jgi:membrane fusion protein